MRPDVSSSKALVFGGTGSVGSAVLRGLAEARVPTVFTYHRSAERAQALAAEYAQRAVPVDLTEPNAARRLVQELDRDGDAPDIFIHCAAISRQLALERITDDDWHRVHLVNAHSAFVACQELAPRMAKKASWPHRSHRRDRSRPIDPPARSFRGNSRGARGNDDDAGQGAWPTRHPRQHGGSRALGRRSVA